MNIRTCQEDVLRIDMYVHILLGLVGSTGNIITGIVIHFKMKRNNPNFLLKVISFSYTCMVLLLLATTLLYNIAQNIAHVLFLFFSLASFTAQWILVFVSCARSASYLWPRKATTLWSNQVVYGSILVIVVMGISLGMPTIVLLMQGDDNQKYDIFYQTFCVGVIPMILLIVSLVVTKTHSAQLIQRQESIVAFEYNVEAIMDKIKAVNKLMVALISTLMLCHLPHVTYKIAFLIVYCSRRDMKYFEESCVNEIIYSLTYNAVCLNASCQILIYTIFSGKFRRGLKSFF